MLLAGAGLSHRNPFGRSESHGIGDRRRCHRCGPVRPGRPPAPCWRTASARWCWRPLTPLTSKLGARTTLVLAYTLAAAVTLLLFAGGALQGATGSYTPAITIISAGFAAAVGVLLLRRAPGPAAASDSAAGQDRT